MNRRQLIEEMDILEDSLSLRRRRLAPARRRAVAAFRSVPPLWWPVLGFAAGCLAGRGDGRRPLRYARAGVGVVSLLRNLLAAVVSAL